MKISGESEKHRSFYRGGLSWNWKDWLGKAKGEGRRGRITREVVLWREREREREREGSTNKTEIILQR